MVAVAAVLYVILAHPFKPGGDLKALARGPMAKLEVADPPRAEPDAPFFGPNGQTVHLADFKGQVLVVNFWATWCAPCVKEMPTLAKLQAAFAGKPVRVVAVSLDRPEDKDAAERFIYKHGPLAFYFDPKYVVPFSLEPRPEGVPITVVFDAQGRERARYEGGTDWDSPEARAVVDHVLALQG